MKIKELSQKDDKALAKLLAETKAKLVKDRFAVASRELAKITEIAKSRKLIAQINTILRERELAAEEKAEKVEIVVEDPDNNVGEPVENKTDNKKEKSEKAKDQSGTGQPKVEKDKK